MGKGDFDILWKRYGVIAELANRAKDIPTQFSKTKLQKLIFLLQEIYGVDCGYDFNFYIYGPFCSQLDADLSILDYWGGVKINPVEFGYDISIGERNEVLREKARDFLSENSDNIERLVNKFGGYTAKDLELISTIIYVMHTEKDTSKDDLLQIVQSIKPRFSKEEILDKISLLENENLIQFA